MSYCTASLSTKNNERTARSDRQQHEPSVILRATTLSTSSMAMTGNEIFNTANHSSRFSGVIWNTACTPPKHNHAFRFQPPLNRQQLKRRRNESDLTNDKDIDKTNHASNDNLTIVTIVTVTQKRQFSSMKWIPIHTCKAVSRKRDNYIN